MIFRLCAALAEAAGPRVGNLERTHRIRAIPAVVEDEGIAGQRPEGRLVDLDGESSLEGGDAGDLPSVGEPARHPSERVEMAETRQLVHIADHKALARIEPGTAVVAGNVEGIGARARGRAPGPTILRFPIWPLRDFQYAARSNKTFHRESDY